jgi:hydroxymethylbilane synthase
VRLTLGSRGSRLALAQTELVAERLRARGVEIDVSLITTTGDKLADIALADFGGKALFVKELEEALLQRRVHAAVHSLKDMPAFLPDGLVLAAYAPRANPGDVLVTRDGAGLDDLPPGARVGTSSLRRRALLLHRRPDLRAEPIRGNVDTRLRKLEEGQYEALILARAGLDRLGARPSHVRALPLDEFLPAVGQGILGIEARVDDGQVLEVLGAVDDTGTRMAALAERAFLERLGAGCHTPVAGYARLDGATVHLDGLVASPDGKIIVRGRTLGVSSRAAALGRALAEDLLSRGAAELLDVSAGGPA